MPAKKQQRRSQKRATKKGRYQQINGMRSSFELKVADILSKQASKKDFEWHYESEIIEYTVPPVPERIARYTPDFPIVNASGKVWYLETKGLWTVADRKKHLLIKKEHPDVDIRLMFQRDNYIRKGSKTKYSDFCRKNNIKWCVGELDWDWFDE